MPQLLQQKLFQYLLESYNLIHFNLNLTIYQFLLGVLSYFSLSSSSHVHPCGLLLLVIFSPLFSISGGYTKINLR